MPGHRHAAMTRRMHEVGAALQFRENGAVSFVSDGILVAPADIPAVLDFPSLFGRAEPRPLELEVGCGKGRFLVAAAQRWPERDFVALELVGALLRKVRDKVARAGLTNVRLLPLEAKEAFASRLPPESLSRVHVYFPDPWPKRRHAKHRLFAPPFPQHLVRALKPRGELLLATDHDPYFREVVAAMALTPGMLRVLPDAFRDIPRGGFDAIFEAAGVPAFRGAWERAGA
jgi:tRNA (guanine-N7-)-methyltransferase